MRPRRAMLRSFIAEQYAAAPLSESVAEAREALAAAEPQTRVRAILAPLLLPHLVEAVEQVIVHANDQPGVRGFAGGLLTYVYNPLDLLQGDGLIGWLDDALVCAMGLRKLEDEALVELDEQTHAAVDVVLESLASLTPELRAAVEGFVADLWASQGRQPGAVAPR